MVTVHLLEELLRLQRYQLAIHLVSPARMAKVNRQFLDHEGSTDVISFDYRDGYEEGGEEPLDLAGEIFISVADANKQAQEFRTDWQEETVRYVVHGTLHLLGYDDLEPAKRKIMKREENRLVKALARQFELAELAA